MCKLKFYVIGLSDSRNLELTEEVKQLIASKRVFSGGLRHHEIVRNLLPQEATWIDVKVPLTTVFEAYKKETEVVVFASGDPLFFGFANTLQREFPDAELVVHPTFNSLQMLAHKALIPYQDMRIVSLTGRPWKGLDVALIHGEPLIGILTDKVKTPAAIAAYLLEYGYSNYRITVGEALGNEEQEQIRSFDLVDAQKEEFALPNCLILQQTAKPQKYFGIPHEEFELLNGRVNMITKASIRLLTLSMLELQHHSCMWDIGSCTGSISIEAKMQFPELDVVAFEVRPEGEQLLRANSRKFGVPGIQFVAGDFCELSLQGFPQPDAVFIGGHGGKLIEMIQKISQVLAPEGIIVFNSVSAESAALCEEAARVVGKKVVQRQQITIDNFNTIIIYKIA